MVKGFVNLGTEIFCQGQWGATEASWAKAQHGLHLMKDNSGYSVEVVWRQQEWLWGGWVGGCVSVQEKKVALGDANGRWTARRSSQSFLKEVNPEHSSEGLLLKLKFQYFGHLIWRSDSLEKTLMLEKIESKRRRGVTKDEMVGCHHWLNGHEFGQTLGDSEGQGSLACCSSRGCKELDLTYRLNNNKMGVVKENWSDLREVQ